MKDFFGNELQLDDTVAVAPKNYRGLVLAKIIKFAPKSVLVEYNNTWNYGSEGMIQTYMTSPGSLIKKQ